MLGLLLSVAIGQNMPTMTSNDVSLIITRKAFVYNVDRTILSQLIKCESNFDQYAINENKWERSLGLVQINTNVHDVTDEQAYDPEFAINFLAKNMSDGKAKKMYKTCYKYAFTTK